MTQLNLDFSNSNNTESTVSNIVVFDIETQKSFSEVSSIPEMRVAVAVSYNYLKQEYKTFTEDNIDLLIEELFNADIVVGYNIISFDYTVLTRYTNKNFKKINTVDMMKIVQEGLGFRPKLDNLVAATLGESKSADGLQSLIWFRDGEIEKVKEYCQKDVEITKKLYDFGKVNNFVYAKSKNGQKTMVPVKW